MLHWIEKQSGRGRLLDHLESFGTKIMIRGPIVHQLRVEWNRNKQVHINPKERSVSSMLSVLYSWLVRNVRQYLELQLFSFFLFYRLLVTTGCASYIHWHSEQSSSHAVL